MNERDAAILFFAAVVLAAGFVTWVIRGGNPAPQHVATHEAVVVANFPPVEKWPDTHGRVSVRLPSGAVVLAGADRELLPIAPGQRFQIAEYRSRILGAQTFLVLPDVDSGPNNSFKGMPLRGTP